VKNDRQKVEEQKYNQTKREQGHSTKPKAPDFLHRFLHCFDSFHGAFAGKQIEAVWAGIIPTARRIQPRFILYARRRGERRGYVPLAREETCSTN